jgi:hypothetical protein
MGLWGKPVWPIVLYLVLIQRDFHLFGDNDYSFPRGTFLFGFAVQSEFEEQVSTHNNHQADDV